MISHNSPLVSIISVNFNANDVTEEFLDSIQKLEYPNLEVVVVDNASTENPIPYLSQKFPFVKFIRSETNLGFAGGNNLGINASNGEYLFFVNNDTVFDQDLILSLLSVFTENPRIGGVSPKIIYEGTSIIQYAGYTPLSFTARNKAIGHQCMDSEDFSDVISTPYLHGAAMMISRKVIKKVGPMPEIYFLYYEELDWSEQIRDAGFQLAVDRRVSILHKASVSVGKESPIKTYYMIRNRWLFIRRNGSLSQKVFFALYTSLVIFPKDLLKHGLKGDGKQLTSLCKGYFWHFRGIN